MIKPPVIVRLLDILQHQVELLRPLQALGLKELADDPLRWNGVLHLLQLSIEVVTDVSAHLLAGNQIAIPDDHRQIVLLMGRHGLLPLEFAEKIAPMTGFRNIVVHGYLSLDPLKVDDILKNHLSDFDDFKMYIYDYLRREGHLPEEKPA